jgi:hypothetical protein
MAVTAGWVWAEEPGTHGEQMQKRLSRIVKALPFRQRSKAETRRRRARRQDQMLQERTRFERRIQTVDRRLRRSIARFLRESSIPNLLTAPMIYSLIAPLVLMDIWISLYQWVCFRVYGVPCVRRQDYLIIDRHRLGYLNAIEKLNCVYCGYANGLFAYLREIAGRTEQYWCPIKHARQIRQPHSRYPRFLEYGDAKGYHERLAGLRTMWNDPAPGRQAGRVRAFRRPLRSHPQQNHPS